MKYLIPYRSKMLSFRIDSQASTLLDFTRSIAAILVVIGHIRALFFVESASLIHVNHAIRAFYFLTSLGHQAVIVFFVLSGFFISSSVIRSIFSQNWLWSDYLNRRLSRLWIVLIPALLLGALWDQVGMMSFSATGVYNGIHMDRYILGFSIAERANILVLLGNALFLQDIITVPFGSNAVLWSLSYEFWYYIMFPFLILFFFSKNWLMKGVHILTFFVLCSFVGSTISTYFIIWLLGFAVCALPNLRINQKYIISSLKAITFVVFISSLFLARIIDNDILKDALTAIFFTFFLYIITRVSCDDYQTSAQKPTRANISSFFASFSYTLYLVHLPPLVFLHAWVLTFSKSKWQPTVTNITIALAIVFVILLYAWIISQFTEAHTNNVRRLVSRRLQCHVGTVIRLE